MTAGMTYNHNNQNEFSFRGRGAYTLTSAGQTIRELYVNAPTGSLTLTDNLLGNNSILVKAGAFNTAGYSISGASLITFGTSGTLTKVINLSSSAITVSRTVAGSAFNFVTDGLTLNTGTSSLIMTNSGVTGIIFTGGTQTFNNVTVQGAGNYALTITGNNTFNTFTVDRSQASKTIVATGTTQTVSNFICNTSGTNTLTITGGTWVKTGAPVNLDYLSVTSSTASPVNIWYAGANSTNGGSNIGWIFTARSYPIAVRMRSPVFRGRNCILDHRYWKWEKAPADSWIGLPMTITGAVYTIQGRTFDGVDDIINVGAKRLGTGNLSVLIWFNPYGFGEGNNGRLIDNGKFIVYVNSTNSKLSATSDGATTINSANSSVTLCSWNCLIITRKSDGKLTFCINDAISGSADQDSGTPEVGATNDMIGNSNATDKAFDGTIGEIVAYSRILTETERHWLYRATRRRYIQGGQ
jgi:hypothetical protein